MVTVLKKQDVLDLLDAMPEEIDVEEIRYRLYLFQQIAAGEAALAADDVVSQDEVERQSDEWLRG